MCENSLEKHINLDWRDLEKEDKGMNNLALKNNERIFSTYKLPENENFPDHANIYIITESDRTLTTILFPSEY